MLCDVHCSVQEPRATRGCRALEMPLVTEELNVRFHSSLISSNFTRPLVLFVGFGLWISSVCLVKKLLSSLIYTGTFVVILALDLLRDTGISIGGTFQGLAWLFRLPLWAADWAVFSHPRNRLSST